MELSLPLDMQSVVSVEVCFFWGTLLLVFFFVLCTTCGLYFYCLHLFVYMFYGLNLTFILVKHFVNSISVKGAIFNKLNLKNQKLTGLKLW